ncbi:MAG: LysR family transcriptional regulator [Alphaproteobacteria bacterium]|nr:LysR family transcriptional regulator [Alphaproteobacteria bacterium]
MDWDKLRIFHAAAEAGSFTHAGEALNMSQSAVSRQVAALEKDLKQALFHRHARGLVLTEQGEILYGTVVEVMNKLHTAETLLADTATKPTGELRITAPLGLGTVWATQRVSEFQALYPDVNVELILNDEQIDIAMRASDVAIWTGEPENPDLIRRLLFRVCVRVYASTGYVRRFGTPVALGDLDRHRIVSYSGRPAAHLQPITWLETAGRKDEHPRVPVFRVNSVIALKYAIQSGIGIGMLPEYMTEGESDLVPLLEDADSPSLEVLFVYPEELKNSKKVKVLRDFLVAQARNRKH